MADLSSFQTNSSQSISHAKNKSSPVKSQSDGGTIFLHWLTALSMVLSLLTGFRISADGISNTWAHALNTYLPQGEIWTWHLLASLILFFCTLSYFIYIRRAALTARNTYNRLRTLTAPTNTRLRWRAINVALHWFSYGGIIILTLTGTLLYLGYGGTVVWLHRIFAWGMFLYILLHLVAHTIYGGIDQLLKLFRPQQLLITPTTKPWALAVAVIFGSLLVGALYAVDQATRPSLAVLLTKNAPILDGNLSDQSWQFAESVEVRTHQGANLNGTGTSTVQIKAVRTKTKIYFAFQWQDPTRSLMRAPTIKRKDGWYVMANKADTADVVDYYEDKFAVLFSLTDQLGGGGSTFLGSNPLPAYPKSPHGRGLHYTKDGRILDMWQWKSTRGGMLGHMDDMYFGPPENPTKPELLGKKRYAGGYKADPGKAIYEYNYIANGPKGYASPVQLKRLPLDLTLLRYELGLIPDNSDESNSKDSKWWFTNENSIAYDKTLDALLPLGTILPSSLNIHTYQGDRADLTAYAKWHDGYWSLEVSRDLHTGSPYDMDFHKGTQIFLWVSVFDHNQTRHTRHQRPVQLDIK